MRARALLLVLGVLLAWGLATLTLLRFDTGAAYPPYSSLRPDPLGGKALYAALAELDATAVARSFEPLDRLPAAAGTTVILAGAEPGDFAEPSAPTWRSLSALAAAGARVVVAFAPRNSRPEPQILEPGQTAPEEEERPAALLPRSFPALAAAALEEDDDGRPIPESAVREHGGEQLPESILCRTSLWFDRLDDNWRVLYRRGEMPVLIERRVGAGTLVLMADAFPLSNEGLRFARESRLLAWLLGEARQVVFDETHLGVTAPAGTMALIRRYRLQPVLATLVVLTLLFAWRAATPLLPAPRPVRDADAASAVSGRDAAAGIAGLLRRGLPPRQLLPAAAESWRQTAGGAGTADPSDLAAVAALAAGPGDPVSTYQRIRAALHKDPTHPRGES